VPATTTPSSPSPITTTNSGGGAAQTIRTGPIVETDNPPESVVTPESEIALFPPNNNFIQTLRELVFYANVAQEQDVDILDQLMCLFDEAYVRSLSSRQYKLIVAKNDLTYAKPSEQGRKRGSKHADFSPAVVSLENGSRDILIRTWMEEGKSVLDVEAVFNCIGQGLSDYLFDQVENHISRRLAAERSPSLLDAYKNEGETAYSNKEEFIGEVFALWQLRSDQLRIRFPQTAGVLEKYARIYPSLLIDLEKLEKFQRAMWGTLKTIDSTPQPAQLVKLLEENKSQRIQDGVPPESWKLTIDGEPEALRIIATEIGRELIFARLQRGPALAFEGTITIDATLANNPEALFEGLLTSPGALLFIPDPAEVPPESNFWKKFAEFNRFKSGRCHLLIGGTASSRECLKDIQPADPHHHITVSMLSKKQLFERILQCGNDDGYLFTDLALETLEGQLPAIGTIKNAQDIWRRIKRTYIQSLLDNNPPAPTEPQATQLPHNLINKALILTTDFGLPKSAYDSIADRNMPQDLKEYLFNMVRAKEVADRRPNVRGFKQPPIRILYTGNNGVGKTTDSRLIAGALYEKGIVQSAAFVELSTAKLMDLTPSAIENLLITGQNGTIFIDEVHQAASTDGLTTGKDFINTIIPMLTNPAWEKTVVIFACYNKKLEDLYKLDEGL
jgi:hypothetical protein